MRLTRDSLNIIRLLLGLLAAICCSGCEEGATPPPTDHPLYKVKDSLILQVPLEDPTVHPAAKRPPVSPNQLPQADGFGFAFYLPGLSFKRPADRKEWPPPEWDHDRVHVWIYPATMGHNVNTVPQPYPPIVGVWIEHHLIKAEDYQEIYGLRCWNFLGSDCSDLTAKSEIHIHADTPRQPSGLVNPLMKAEYISARYGGVNMFWYTSIENLPKWREIDAHVWEIIDAWNVAAGSAAASKP
jgi:hypothetical protein